MINQWLSYLEKITRIDSIIILRGITSLLAFIVYLIIRRILNRIIFRSSSDPNRKFRINKTVEAFLYFLFAIALWQIWLPGMSSLVTYLGLVSAGIAVALKEPISNLFGWLHILWQKPFEVGDRIQIGEVIGDVIDQRLFSFLLIEVGNWVNAEQSTGRVVYIPNSKVFNEPLFSFNAGLGGYIWNELPLLVTFESNWAKAKEELQSILEKHVGKINFDPMKLERKHKDEKFLIHTPASTPIVYTSMKDSGILLTMRFLCKPRNRRAKSEIIWEATLDMVIEHADINIAYPTQRIVIKENDIK